MIARTWRALAPADRRDTLHGLWALPLAGVAFALLWFATP